MSPGTLYGVGLGPGDPELITIKAARLIGAADVIAYHSARHGRSIARGVAEPYLRGDQVVLCPGGSVTVDAVRFADLARWALAAGDAAAAREALALYGGELLPADRYEEWAETRREQLSQSHLDLLRLDGRWEAVAELDPGDERAHLALMRRHAANGDRHAAERFHPAADPQLARAGGLEVAHPLRTTAGRHQVALPVVLEQVDRVAAPFAGRAAAHAQLAGAAHAHAEAGQPGHERIEDVVREPSGALVVGRHRLPL